MLAEPAEFAALRACSQAGSCAFPAISRQSYHPEGTRDGAHYLSGAIEIIAGPLGQPLCIDSQGDVEKKQNCAARFVLSQVPKSEAPGAPGFDLL